MGENIGIQLWMPTRQGLRPVSRPAREGEQLAAAE